jgi:hypothetical protein
MHEVTTDERGGWQADEGGSAGLLFVVEAKGLSATLLVG